METLCYRRPLPEFMYHLAFNGYHASPCNPACMICPIFMLPLLLLNLLVDKENLPTSANKCEYCKYNRNCYRDVRCAKCTVQLCTSSWRTLYPGIRFGVLKNYADHYCAYFCTLCRQMVCIGCADMCSIAGCGLSVCIPCKKTTDRRHYPGDTKSDHLGFCAFHQLCFLAQSSEKKSVMAENRDRCKVFRTLKKAYYENLCSIRLRHLFDQTEPKMTGFFHKIDYYLEDNEYLKDVVARKRFSMGHKEHREPVTLRTLAARKIQDTILECDSPKCFDKAVLNEKIKMLELPWMDTATLIKDFKPVDSHLFEMVTKYDIGQNTLILDFELPITKASDFAHYAHLHEATDGKHSCQISKEDKDPKEDLDICYSPDPLENYFVFGNVFNET